MELSTRLAALLLPLALAACAGTQAQQPVAPPAQVASPSMAETDRAIAQARVDTAELAAGMDAMLSKQAEMQKLMLVMLDQAMSPEVIGALMASAKQMETAFAEAGIEASPVE